MARSKVVVDVTSADNSEQTLGSDVTAGNLPSPLTRIVGRERALRELSGLLWGTRLLTLSGPGGVGKTRLAVALAEAVRADLVDGAWWVDLSATVDPRSVAQVVAAAVLPGERASETPLVAVARMFTSSSLLVLDNCEQVVGGCAQVVIELLRRTQSLRVIATSREPLGVPGEQVWRVSGLRVDQPTGPGENPGAAVELFLQRARESGSLFDPGDAGVLQAVRRICRSLDGMPLSIELAAARVPVLGVAEIAERLEHGIGFLSHAGRVVPDRHRTLRDTLEWSHRMLEPPQQQLFRQLGVFKGSFSLGAAEAIGADEAEDANQVLDLLSDLVNRSMVQLVEDRAAPRYRLLETVRHYALEKLAESGESRATRQRQAAYFYQLARDANPVAAPADQQVRVLEELELEHDNLLEALHWLLATSARDAAQLSSLLWPFWYQRGYYGEARDAFEQTLSSGQDMPATARAEALRGAGEVAFFQCDYAVGGRAPPEGTRSEPRTR